VYQTVIWETGVCETHGMSAFAGLFVGSLTHASTGAGE
jgi:hypothetical protein